MTLMYKDLREMWQSMLEAQRAQNGFTLTVRDLTALWKVASTSTTEYRLSMLVQNGFVITHGTGKKKTYRALDENQIRVPNWDNNL